MDTQRSLYEIEVALSKTDYFNYIKNIVAFNVNGLSDRLKILHECDMLVLSKSGYLTEIEIKRSWSDFVADFNKSHSHESEGIIKYFYYCIPECLLDRAYNKLDEKNIDYTGIITYDEDLKIKLHGHRVKIIDNAYSYPFITNKIYRKLFLEEQLEIARLEAMRVIKLKEELINNYEKDNIKKNRLYKKDRFNLW